MSVLLALISHFLSCSCIKATFFFSVSVLSKNKVINLQVVKPAWKGGAGMTSPDTVR